MSDLVPANNIDMSKYRTQEGGIMGLEDVGSTDFIMPRYRLLQNTSSDGTPGKFVSTLTAEEFEQMAITILAVNKFRVMWPKQFNRGDAPLCRSTNGRTMVAGGIGDGECVKCQYASWDNGRPDCAEGYTFLIVDHNNVPAMISFRGSSNRPVKKFLSSIVTKGLPPFAYKVLLKAKRERNDKGNYFVAEFELSGMHEEVNMDQYAGTLRELQNFLPKDTIIEGRESENSENTNTNNTNNDPLPF